MGFCVAMMKGNTTDCPVFVRVGRQIKMVKLNGLDASLSLLVSVMKDVCEIGGLIRA